MSRLLRTVIAVFLFAEYGTLLNCTSETSSGTHLQQEVDRLQKRTIPPGSRLLDQHLHALQGWVARADWEFQANYRADTYNEWLAGKLRRDFQIHEDGRVATRFSKYDQADVEILSVVTTPSAGMLRVAVKLEIYPD